MIYRIRLTLNFETEDPMNDIKDKALDHFPEAFTINPDKPYKEQSFIITEICGHEEAEPVKCVIADEHWTD